MRKLLAAVMVSAMALAPTLPAIAAGNSLPAEFQGYVQKVDNRKECHYHTQNGKRGPNHGEGCMSDGEAALGALLLLGLGAWLLSGDDEPKITCRNYHRYADQISAADYARIVRQCGH